MDSGVKPNARVHHKASAAGHSNAHRGGDPGVPGHAHPAWRHRRAHAARQRRDRRSGGRRATTGVARTAGHRQTPVRTVSDLALGRHTFRLRRRSLDQSPRVGRVQVTVSAEPQHPRPGDDYRSVNRDTGGYHFGGQAGHLDRLRPAHLHARGVVHTQLLRGDPGHLVLVTLLRLDHAARVRADLEGPVAELPATDLPVARHRVPACPPSAPG